MTGIEKAARVARILAAAALAAVALASLAPEARPPAELDRLPAVSALGHVVTHFVVAVLCLAGWHERSSRIVPMLAAFAVLMEAIQTLVPARTFSMVELIGNLLGVALGWAFFRSMRRFSRNSYF